MNDDNVRGLANGLTNYGDKDFALYLRRSFARSMGYSKEMLARPTVGIAYTPSGFNNCHRHFPEMLEAVKRGVIAACRWNSRPFHSARSSSIRPACAFAI